MNSSETDRRGLNDGVVIDFDGGVVIDFDGGVIVDRAGVIVVRDGVTIFG